LARGHSGVEQLPAIRGAQIELHARRRRDVSGRHHREPRKRIRLLAPREALEWAVEPFGGGWKLSGERGSDFRADFVAASANCRADRDDHVFGARAELHAHAAKRFLRDARERSAPTCVNCGDGAARGVREENRNAIRGLHGEQDARRARE